MMHLAFLLFVSARICYAQDTTPCDYKQLTQTLDHSGQVSGTFQQRYSIFDEFYKPGGPILMFQGEEGSLDCANTTIFYSFAKELGGMAVSLEHRYFGQSMPFENSTASWETANLKYLTLDNVMSDATNFISMLKANYTTACDSKVIVTSGSYGAFLAAMFRFNHPGTFFGALAAASPFKAMSTSDSDPAKFGWYNWADRVYRDTSMEAYSKARESFTVLSDMVLAGNVSTLQADLGLCDPVVANSTTSLTLPALYATIWYSASQSNYNIARAGRLPLAKSLDRFINATLKASGPLAVLNDTFWTIFGQPGSSAFRPCFNISESIGDLLAPGLEELPFSYLSCNYHPTISNIAPDTMFYPIVHKWDDYVSNCEEQFGIAPMDEEQLRRRYHFTAAEVQSATQIIFSEGQFDPTTAIGPGPLPLTPNKCAGRRIYVSEMAHREDLFLPDPSDKPSVVDARNTELQIIKQWLQYCD